jgi:hypothetical protein
MEDDTSDSIDLNELFRSRDHDHQAETKEEYAMRFVRKQNFHLTRFSETVFYSLGADFGGKAACMLDSKQRGFGIKLPKFIRVCDRAIAYCLALQMSGLDHQSDEEYQPRIFCENLSHLVSEPEFRTFRQLDFENEISKALERHDLFQGIALLLFKRAASLFDRGEYEDGLRWVYQATEFLEIANFTEGMSPEYVLPETEKYIRSGLAITAAHARHKETKQIEADVFKWLEENDRPDQYGKKLSADKRAETLVFVQPKLFNIEFSTAKKYVTKYRQSVKP